MLEACHAEARQAEGGSPHCSARPCPYKSGKLRAGTAGRISRGFRRRVPGTPNDRRPRPARRQPATTQWLADQTPPPHASAHRELGIPARAAGTPADLLDVSPWYNAALIGSWHPDAEGNDLTGLPPGEQPFGDTRFDVRGVVQLAGEPNLKQQFPSARTGLELHRTFRCLHALHATGWAETMGLVPSERRSDARALQAGWSFASATRPNRASRGHLASAIMGHCRRTTGVSHIRRLKGMSRLRGVVSRGSSATTKHAGPKSAFRIFGATQHFARRDCQLSKQRMLMNRRDESSLPFPGRPRWSRDASQAA